MHPRLRDRLERHARFTSEIRAFFSGRGYLEVDTPTLSPFLVPEPSLEVFRSDYLPAKGAPRPLWLTPSPELWMKRLLGRGSGNIYQISRSFRNGDHESPIHNPEFRLLEWYTVGKSCLDSIRDTEHLFEHLLRHDACLADPRTLEPPFTRLRMAEAFDRYAGIDLAACGDSSAMVRAARSSGIAAAEDTTWEQAFHLVFLTLVEPRLPAGRPLVLTDYPALIPTTARRKKDTPWSERWELYVTGVELANCYTEETDPRALRELLRQEAVRKADARIPHLVDEGLAEAFPPGFPECTGTALGVDRMEMLFTGEKSLEGVILFPFSAIMGAQSDTR